MNKAHLELQKRSYNRCRPAEALDPSDDRNVDVDSLHPNVRGSVWTDRLARRFELADEPALVLFSGLPGTGKSTELRRLRQRLSDPAGSNYLVVLVDADDWIDLTVPIDVPDVYAAVLTAAERAVLSAEGSTRAPMTDGALTRMWNWLARTDVELSKVSLAQPAQLAIELKTRPTLRQRVHDAVANHLTRFLGEAHDILRDLDLRAKKLGRSGIVILVDQLERLRGVSTTWEKVLESAERLFVNGAPFLRLPVPALYTLPPALMTRRAFSDVHFLPMWRLLEKDGRPCAPGVLALHALVYARLPQDVLCELLGATNVAPTLELLIQESGGYPRDLVRLLQSLVAIRRWPIDFSEVTATIGELRDAYRRVVPADAFAWLARVQHDRYLTLDSVAQNPVADMMLSNNVVLRYRNGEEWFALHPAVQAIPGVAALVAAGPIVDSAKSDSTKPVK